MKRLLLIFLLVLGASSWGWGQTGTNHFTESFENPDLWSSYTTGIVGFDSGDWDFVAVFPESASASYDGSKACRINDDVNGASITSPSVDSVGTVSFYYHRPFSGTGTFSLQKSVGGGAFVELTTQNFDDVTTPTLFSYDVNDASNDIRIKIVNDDNTAHLTIDYITISNYSGVSSPTISVAPTGLTGFSYAEGSGPSSSQSFTVSGSDLTADVTVTPPTNYEISTDNSTFQSTAITLSQSSGSVAETTLYTRLKAGLSTATYNQDITITSTDATDKTVSCEGDVMAVESLPFSESFDVSSIPSGWSFTDFTVANSANAGGSANEVELTYSNDNPETSEIVTPPINTSGISFLDVSWNQKVDFYEGGSGTDYQIQLLTSTDGLTFSNIAWSQTVTADETELKQISLDASDGVGSGTLYLKWLYYQNNSNRFSFWYIDDVSVSEVSVANPSGFTVANTTTNQIDLSWTNAVNSDGVWVVAREASAVDVVISDGEELYNYEDFSATGNFTTDTDLVVGEGYTGSIGNILVYSGTGTSCSVSNLSANTAYYFTIFNEYGSARWSSGVSTDGATLQAEASNHVTTFTASANGHNQIDLTWGDNDGATGADGFLIKGSTTSYAAITDPSDGTAEADGGLVLNVASGVEAASFSSLSELTTYYFKIYPYTNSGSDIDYKTDGTVPTASATTEAAPAAPNAWINEIHYDNDGGDVNELVEVVIENAGSYNLADFSITLYNGSNGEEYSTETLDGFTEGSTSGDFTFYTLNYTNNSSYGSIQNGPDALALSYNGSLISGQFLSYEASFDATNGVANGVTSSDIGVSETGSTPVGESLQLTGSGTSYSDFTWADSATATSGALNNSQSFDSETPGLWKTDAASTDWNTASNWSDGNVPTADIDVSIPSGIANSPTISSSVVCNSLTVASGATLTIEGTGKLTVTNALDNSGSVVLNSTPSNFASLILGSVTGSGTLTYNRFFNNVPENDLIAAPIDGMTFEDLLGDNIGQISSGSIGGVPGYHLFGPYVVGDGTYDVFNATDDASTVIVAGKGYRVGAASATGGSLSFGSTHAGSAAYSHLNSDVSVSLDYNTESGDSWNLVGNPYASYVTMSSLLTANTAVMHNESFGIYAYNASNTGEIWDVYNLNNADGLSIAPGQGFFVRGLEQAGNTFSFTPAMQTHSGSDDFITGRSMNTVGENYFVELLLQSGEQAFGTDIYFNDNGSDGLDVGYDSSLWQASLTGFGIYSHLLEDNQGVPMAIQTLHTARLSDLDTALPLGVDAGNGMQLVFTIQDMHLPDNTDVYLEDMALGSYTNLLTQDYIVMTNSALSGTGRFYLHLGENTTLSNDEVVYDDVLVFSTKGSGEITVSGLIEEDMSLELYDLSGRKLINSALLANSSAQTIPVSQFMEGSYIAILKGPEGSRAVKLILTK